MNHDEQRKLISATKGCTDILKKILLLHPWTLAKVEIQPTDVRRQLRRTEKALKGNQDGN